MQFPMKNNNSQPRSTVHRIFHQAEMVAIKKTLTMTLLRLSKPVYDSVLRLLQLLKQDVPSVHLPEPRRMLGAVSMLPATDRVSHQLHLLNYQALITGILNFTVLNENWLKAKKSSLC